MSKTADLVRELQKLKARKLELTKERIRINSLLTEVEDKLDKVSKELMT